MLQIAVDVTKGLTESTDRTQITPRAGKALLNALNRPHKRHNRGDG